MSGHTSQEITPRDAWVVRLGGLVNLLILALVVVVNFVLTPKRSLLPENARPEEIASFFSAHADQMALANGLRNLVLFLLPIFAVGLYTLIARTAETAAKAWATMALVASAAVMAVGTVNNGVETAAFVNLSVFAEHPELRRLLWSLSAVVFAAVRLVWAAINTGFSVGGWLSGALPRWLCIVGLLSAVSSLVSAVGIAPLLAGGWPNYTEVLVPPTILIFNLGVSIQMLRRAAAIEPACGHAA
jgi:hypothetical protein